MTVSQLEYRLQVIVVAGMTVGSMVRLSAKQGLLGANIETTTGTGVLLNYVILAV